MGMQILWAVVFCSHGCVAPNLCLSVDSATGTGTIPFLSMIAGRRVVDFPYPTRLERNAESIDRIRNSLPSWPRSG